MMDIHVSIPGKTWLYGDGITAELGGDVKIMKKKDGKLTYTGEVDVRHGMYKISERTLTITEGKMLLGGEDFMAALISAKASCTIGTVSIDVILGGTLNNPIITFQSDPIMERKDIISYLAFGVPSNKNMPSQNSEIQGSSFDILASFAENDVKGVMGTIVPVDVVSIQPSEGSWGVGKYITDKLFAKYEYRSGQDESPQTILDYTLDKHFSINSQFGDPTTSGIDLFWKHGY
jgi:autotransporter translocation and assembly factor TamB